MFACVWLQIWKSIERNLSCALVDGFAAHYQLACAHLSSCVFTVELRVSHAVIRDRVVEYEDHAAHNTRQLVCRRRS
jgi:hypothetical protein